jgi:hypothetical protein
MMLQPKYGGAAVVALVAIVGFGVYAWRDYFAFSRAKDAEWADAAAQASSVPTLDPPAAHPTGTTPTVDERVRAAMAIQPPVPTLRAGIQRAIPALREHISAGRRKMRDGAGCIADLRDRQDRLNTLMTSTTGAEPDVWMLWDDPQRDLADGFENVIIPARMCVDCAAEDVKECDAAGAELKKLETMLAHR